MSFYAKSKEQEQRLNRQAQLWGSWRKDKSSETLSELMRTLRPTIDNCLTSYGGGDQGLRTRAEILARESLDSYDPSKGAVTTHVSATLRRLNRVAAERRMVIHVPDNVQSGRLNIMRYVADYKDKHDGQEPSYLTIAHDLQITPRRAAKAINTTETKESQFVSEKGDDVVATQKRPEDLWKDAVYHDLLHPMTGKPDNKAAKVFEWMTGYLGAPVLPQKEIAARLKISDAAVSQRIGTLKKKLDQIQELPDIESLT